jgi:hypothetical protein
MISQELLGTVYSFECQFEALPSLWVSLDVTVEQALETIKTGLLHNKVVTKIKLFVINVESDSIGFIYDVVAAKTGNNPWSITTS